MGLGYTGLNKANVGVAWTISNDDYRNGNCEVFGKLRHEGNTYKGALDCKLNTRVFGEWKVCGKVTL